MMEITMTFPTESSCKEGEKWLRFLTTGHYERRDGRSLVVNIRMASVFYMMLDVLKMHIPPVDWERTEIMGEWK